VVTRRDLGALTKLGLSTSPGFVMTAPAQPHGDLEPIFDNIWFVRGGWPMPVPLRPRISRSMTILRDPTTGSVTLVNSMRLSEAGLLALEAIGPIKHVIRLASMHGADDAFYRERYGAKVHALRGTYYSSGLTADADPAASYFAPDAHFDVGTTLPIRGATVHVMDSPKQREASILLDRNGGILLSGDYFHNTPAPDEFTNTLAAVGMRLAGLACECNVGVGWVMMSRPSREDLLGLLKLPFEHVLPIHGEPVIGNARERYRPAIEKFARRAAPASDIHASAQHASR